MSKPNAVLDDVGDSYSSDSRLQEIIDEAEKQRKALLSGYARDIPQTKYRVSNYLYNRREVEALHQLPDDDPDHERKKKLYADLNTIHKEETEQLHETAQYNRIDFNTKPDAPVQPNAAPNSLQSKRNLLIKGEGDKEIYKLEYEIVDQKVVADIPEHIDADKGPMYLSLALQSDDGSNMPKDGAVFLNVNYNKAGKLMSMTYPEPIIFEDGKCKFVQEGGKEFFLKINEARFKDLQKQIEENQLGVSVELAADSASVAPATPAIGLPPAIRTGDGNGTTFMPSPPPDDEIKSGRSSPATPPIPDLTSVVHPTTQPLHTNTSDNSPSHAIASIELSSKMRLQQSKVQPTQPTIDLSEFDAIIKLKQKHSPAAIAKFEADQKSAQQQAQSFKEQSDARYEVERGVIEKRRMRAIAEIHVEELDALARATPSPSRPNSANAFIRPKTSSKFSGNNSNSSQSVSALQPLADKGNPIRTGVVKLGVEPMPLGQSRNNDHRGLS